MWLSIDDKYEVSTDGEIRNKKTMRILKSWVSSSGYISTRLGGRDSRKCGVHRIVAEMFLPAPTEEGLEVDHIDRNKQNNNVYNLRWVSKSVNQHNRNIELKPRANSILKEHHIRVIMGKKPHHSPSYVVIFNRKDFKHYGCFKTLNEAKDFRDSIINVSV